jgi:hypothetical protein
VRKDISKLAVSLYLVITTFTSQNQYKNACFGLKKSGFCGLIYEWKKLNLLTN